MGDRVPAWRRKRVATLPGEALLAYRSFAGAFSHMEDRVGRGAMSITWALTRFRG